MRGNGLSAQSYTDVCDVDPDLAGDALLALRDAGIAAYVVLPDDGDKAQVFADRRAVAQARDVLRVLAPETIDATDDVWAEIVAGYDQEATEPLNPWALPPPDDPPDPDPAPPRAAPQMRIARDPVDPLNSPAQWDDEGHFVPPDLPPMPRGDLVSRLAWTGLFGGPLLMLLATVLSWALPRAILFGCAAAFVGGLVTLVLRMRDDRDGSGGDDGAVV